MIQALKYQGFGVFKDKEVLILSEDIGGLTLIGRFVRTELVQKLEEDKENNEVVKK
jgi:methyl coenzyme M reductase subunit C-like uncharacterized protein (methanogenesis marker protein 7)